MLDEHEVQMVDNTATEHQSMTDIFVCLLVKELASEL